MKENQSNKKLVLKKETVAHLDNDKMAKIRGGEHTGCWENLWTLYHCGVIYTKKDKDKGPKDQ